MIKKIFLFVLCIPIFSFSQNIDEIFGKNGELYFSFEYKNKSQLDKLSKIISIDHKTNGEMAFAYANKKEFAKFLEKGINYTIIKKEIPDFTNNNSKNNWDYYPTYNEYTEMMQAFADSFPDICKLHSLGTLNSGREILIVQISDNVGVKENEPSFLYTSSMHGDELAGYVLTLRLIHTILNGYDVDNRLTNLVNEIDIWINPLANPDGAYAGGNQNVWSATRYNANWVDLNRNYPDPQDGPHPDGNAWQKETELFMGLADTVNFTIAANMHGGVEVCNYPWDTWSPLTADNDWWEHVATEYADSCQANSGWGYFNYLNDGITNGHDWYEVDGGRQDYMNYFKHCREFTLELSDDKTPNPNDLPTLWDANYASLINYMEQSLYGLRGIVTDSITEEPLKAKVEIIMHDVDSSHIYSSMPIGNYHRYLYQGNYNITFSKFGYESKTINATILNHSASIEDIQLVPDVFVEIKQEDQIKKGINNTLDILGRKNYKKEVNKPLIQIGEDGKVIKQIIIE
ncbi:MAG: M14 family zinc carboxypeptidase [Bacteroidota bacterium]|nr:M14 family zinc carboxypeptidase [Bacteroidota bacterium]